MFRSPPAAVTAGLLMFACAHPAAAQIDYRNLDDDRPVRVEDAYPIERHAFEVLLPYAFAREAGGSTHAASLELTWGALRDVQFGVAAPLAFAEPAGGPSASGLAGLRAFALINFNTESRSLPALSLRADGLAPVGPLGGEVWRAELKAIATRSFGRSRLHLNGAVGIGPDGATSAAEGASRWWAGAALDRTLYRQSLLLVGEVYARRESHGAPLEVNASLGARWQWTPTLVLDAGVTRRLSATGPDIGVTIGLSHAFAIAGLIPSPRTAQTAGGADAHRH